MEAKCLGSCPWRIYGSWKQHEATFIIKSYEKIHKCSRTKWYRVRSAALEKLRGSVEDHYALLGPYVSELKRKNPTSLFQIVCDREYTGAPPIFKRIYIGFYALKNGFLQDCRPIIGFDGCFLKTFLGGQLLSAIGVDGNNQIFLIAWAVVEGENYDAWKWFLGLFFDDLQITEGYGMTIVSDQQKIVRSMEESELNRVLEEMAADSPQAHQAFISIGLIFFCQAYISTNCKSDNVTNNISKTFNGYILNARSKPIVDMLEEIRRLLMQRMYMKRVMIVKWTDDICPNIRKKLEINKEERRFCIVIPSGNLKFEVQYMSKIHVVNIDNRSCSCWRWDLIAISCNHAVSCIVWMKDDPDKYGTSRDRSRGRASTSSSGRGRESTSSREVEPPHQPEEDQEGEHPTLQEMTQVAVEWQYLVVECQFVQAEENGVAQLFENEISEFNAYK
ncbi:hypothetical protein Cni_G03125 [Canna indica]|uniref:SWIM-type domain-containing protein n=1 Tax=Canna indica TaxID=4628 RepID=A0AAQ3JRX7_9LILI|nr:hypothetical protein Cni_G03125 [Canna indica]